ncbi:twin-arginine translocase TatA/TatE family subunit [Deinococcus multiflagellatus]|uniref:Sec-independent protein translocase protein TatA n=1 Tax=Deinococcus multiflagellatus TaxID=1656887 RepID=A0ABW1ZKC2_9DEIO|nr:twin-arginine translocase TatA/TatE family subunit [Deinococcus multiflagellatus]MBZ9713282.1 twin-arginine translocase TatA/TatE family subunit [Deinococcus multiflagellatus]
MSIGPLEIILLIVIIALVFGARKLPELGKGLGQGIKEFKRETRASEDRPVTDVPSRQLDPSTGAPLHTPAESVTERRG